MLIVDTKSHNGTVLLLSSTFVMNDISNTESRGTRVANVIFFSVLLKYLGLQLLKSKYSFRFEAPDM